MLHEEDTLDGRAPRRDREALVGRVLEGGLLAACVALTGWLVGSVIGFF